MKISEILREAKADIQDPLRMAKGNWAQGVVESEKDLLAVGQVCAVTSVARVCLRHKLISFKFTKLTENMHECNCEHCSMGWEEEEEAIDLNEVMENQFDHPARDVLDRAALTLYHQHAEGVNDSKERTHADVMSMYDLAIKLAEDEENGVVVAESKV